MLDKKGYVLGGLLVAALFAGPALLRAHCGFCGAGGDKAKAEKSHAHSESMESGAGCLFGIEGAKVKVTESKDGVFIKITSKDKAVASKIKKLASARQSGEACACGAKSEKHVKCPDCAKAKKLGKKCESCALKKKG